MFYRLYSLECAEGVYVGVKVSDTEKDSNNLTASNALRYYLRCNKKNNTYVKLCSAINKCGFAGFTIKFDSRIFEVKDEAYDRMSTIQSSQPNLLNDFIINNKKVLCDCGHNVREIYMDVHKTKYCSITKCNNTQSSIFD